MHKVKLTESELRRVVAKILLEQDPADAQAGPEDENNRSSKISEKNTPGLESQIGPLALLLRQTSGTGIELTAKLGETYPSIDDLLGTGSGGILADMSKQTGIAYTGGYDPDEIVASRIKIVKEYLKFQIILGLLGKLPDQDHHTVAFFFKDEAYVREGNANWQFQSNGVKTAVELMTIRDALYPTSTIKLVSFGTQAFYNKLSDPAFVSKLTTEQGFADDRGGYGTGFYVSKDLAADVVASGNAELETISRLLPSLYEQFDSDYVEEFFCLPLLYPNYWQQVKTPQDHPLYTPWRQTYVMLNIMAQAMSIPGGLECLYLKFADYCVNGPRKGSMGAQPSAMDAFSTTVFIPLNESKKIMIAISELRRVIEAALLNEAGGLGSSVSAATELGSDAAGVVKSTAQIAKQGTVDFLKAISKSGMERRDAILDAIISAATGTAKTVAKFDDLIRRFPAIADVLKDAAAKIGKYADDELIPEDFWARTTGGKNPTGSKLARSTIIDLLKKRAESLSANSPTPMNDAVQDLANIAPADSAAAADVIQTVLSRGGEDILLSADNIKRITAALLNSADYATTSVLQSAIESVTRGIYKASLSDVPPIVTRLTDPAPGSATRIFSTKISFDEINSAFTIIKTEINQAGDIVAPGTRETFNISTRAGDFFTRVESLLTAAGDSGSASAIGTRIADVKAASLGKLSDGTPIAEVLVEQSAANNSQGVLKAAMALLTDPTYASVAAKEGEVMRGASVWKAASATANNTIDRLDSFGVSVSEPLKLWYKNTGWKQIVAQTLVRSFFVPGLIGKSALKLTFYPLYSTTTLGRLAKWVNASWFRSGLLGMILGGYLAKKYRYDYASTPGKRAQKDKSDPVMLKLVDIAAEGEQSVPLLNFVAAFMDNFMFSGTANGLDNFPNPGPITADNSLTAFGQVIGGAAEELAKALRAYDAQIAAGPDEFPKLQQTASSGAIEQNVSAAVESASRFGSAFVSFLTLREKGNVDDVIRSANDFSRAASYEVERTERNRDMSFGNTDWTKLEGARQSATKDVLDKLEARKSGSNAATPTKVTVVPYKNVLISPWEKSNFTSLDTFQLFSYSLITGVSDPAYADQVTIFAEGLGEEPLLRAVLKKASEKDPETVQITGQLEQDYVNTFGVTVEQYNQLKKSLASVSNVMRPQNFIRSVPAQAADEVSAVKK